MPVPTANELVSVMPKLYAYFSAQTNIAENVFDALAVIDNELKRSQRAKKKQTNISDFGKLVSS